MATNIKKIEIGQIRSRFVNHTNRMKAANSEANNILLGFPTDENSFSLVPYSGSRGKVIQNGIEIMSDVSVIVDENNGQTDITVYENIFDYFQAVDGLTVKDIGVIESSAWDGNFIDNNRLNTEGIMIAVISWGNPAAFYDQDFFLPSWYYHTIIKAILQHTGLTVVGDILTDERFTRLVMPYWGKSFLYPDSFIQSSKAQGIPDGGTNAPSTIGQRMEILRAYGNINETDDWYEHNSDFITVDVVLFVSITVQLWGTATQTWAELILLRGGVETSLATSVPVTTPNPTGNFSITETDIFLQDGDKLYIDFFSDSSTSPTVAFTVDSGEFTINPQNTVDRSNVNWNVLLSSEEISCMDLLSDFFVRFSLIPKQIGQVLYLKSLEEICADKSGAIDWSSKVIFGKKISFNPGDYAQVNNFDYQDSEDVGDPALGRGSFNLQHTKLPDTKQVFESLFHNTMTVVSIGPYRTAIINVYDSTSADIPDFVMEPGVRLLTLREKDSDEPAISFFGVNRNDYKVGYFVDSSREFDTGWNYFLSDFYSRLIASLEYCKILNRQFNLNEVDIRDYDPHKMVWDGTNYYIVNKISNYVEKKPVTIELFKVL